MLPHFLPPANRVIEGPSRLFTGGGSRCLLQEAKKLIAVDPSVGENAAQGPALNVLGVNRNRNDIGAIEVSEVVVASLGAGELPALLLEDPDQLSGANRRKPTAHAATVIRSISAG